MDPDPNLFNFSFNAQSSATSIMMADIGNFFLTQWPLILALIILIIFSGFFSACETAFTSVSETRLRALANTKKRAKFMLTLHSKYDQLISTLLIGNNLVNIGASTIGTIIFVALLGEQNGAIVSTAVLTIVVLIFGEITPKMIAKERPDGYLMLMAYPILIVYYIFWPFAKIFDGWKWLLTKIFRFNKKQPKFTEEEFAMVVTDIKDEGVINQTEHDLIKKSLKFDDSLVKDVMQPLSSLVYLTNAMTVNEMKDIFLENNYSRVPYIDSDTGHVLGVILQRDFYEMIIEKNVTLGEIINPCLFVKGNSRVALLFNRMKKVKQMMAMVLDDDRHLIGVITMEDCLEELVGEIDDEQDAEDDEEENSVSLTEVEKKGHSQHRRSIPTSKLKSEVQTLDTDFIQHDEEDKKDSDNIENT